MAETSMFMIVGHTRLGQQSRQFACLLTRLLGRISISLQTRLEMPVPGLRHPLGSREMALPDALSTLGLFLRINLQHDARNLSPIGTLCVGVEQAQIGHEMLLVVSRQKRLDWSGVGNLWWMWHPARLRHMKHCR
jgi:hypothetical protein